MDSLFLLDTSGDQQLFDGDAADKRAALYKNKFSGRLLADDKEDSEDEADDVGEIELFGVKIKSKDFCKVVTSATVETADKGPSKLSIELAELTEKVNEAAENAGSHKVEKRRPVLTVDVDTAENQKERKANVEKDMKQTVLVPGFEQLHALPTVPRRKQPILNRAERAKTKGKDWFDMPATEVTDEMRNELKIIQMRSVLDPKHFYKKNDLKVLPKYFQIGTVQHSPLDHYSERHTRKAKKSLVDELMADEAFQKFNKRKYNEVIQRTDKYAHRKAMKKMKKMKKSK